VRKHESIAIQYQCPGSSRTLKIRTSALALDLAFYVGGPTGMNGRRRRRALRHTVEAAELLPEAPGPQRRPQRKPDRAPVFQAMLDTGQARNRADLARLLGCSRAWVTKVLATSAE
jgi:hypothetical protein